MPCILFATDGSTSAGNAGDFAAQLALALKLPLCIVNVIDPSGALPKPLEEFSRAEHLTREEMIELVSTELLDDAKKRAEEHGVEAVGLESRRGDIVQTILELAAEKQATAIVVGKRGHGTLIGLLIGSVTQKLVSLAPYKVIVVP